MCLHPSVCLFVVLSVLSCLNHLISVIVGLILTICQTRSVGFWRISKILPMHGLANCNRGPNPFQWSYPANTGYGTQQVCGNSLATFSMITHLHVLECHSVSCVWLAALFSQPGSDLGGLDGPGLPYPECTVQSDCTWPLCGLYQLKSTAPADTMWGVAASCYPGLASHSPATGMQCTS